MRPDITINREDCPIVTTYEEWLNQQDMELDEDAEWPVEGDFVTNILTLDFTHWMMRHTAGGVIDDGHLSAVRDMRKKAIQFYNDATGKEYFDINRDKIWGD